MSTTWIPHVGDVAAAAASGACASACAVKPHGHAGASAWLAGRGNVYVEHSVLQRTALAPPGHVVVVLEEEACVPVSLAALEAAVPHAALAAAPEPFDVPLVFGSVVLALRRHEGGGGDGRACTGAGACTDAGAAGVSAGPGRREALGPVPLPAWRTLCDSTDAARAAALATSVCAGMLAGRVDANGKKRKRPSHRPSGAAAAARVKKRAARGGGGAQRRRPARARRTRARSGTADADSMDGADNSVDGGNDDGDAGDGDDDAGGGDDPDAGNDDAATADDDADGASLGGGSAESDADDVDGADDADEEDGADDAEEDGADDADEEDGADDADNADGDGPDDNASDVSDDVDSSSTEDDTEDNVSLALRAGSRPPP